MDRDFRKMLPSSNMKPKRDYKIQLLVCIFLPSLRFLYLALLVLEIPWYTILLKLSAFVFSPDQWLI